MKYLVLTIALGFLMCSCADKKNLSSETIAEVSNLSSDDLEQKALRNYQDNPKGSIKVFKELAAQFEKEGNILKAATVNLNVSNIYDEHFMDYKWALEYATKALVQWQGQKDEMQIANLKNHIGYLNGKAGDFDKAKLEIMESIRLYNKMAYGQGIAIAKFNLARVSFEEGKFEEAVKPFEEGLKFWKGEENSGSVFNMNTFGMELYRALGEAEKAEELQHENYIMITQIKLPESEVEKFKSLVK